MPPVPLLTGVYANLASEEWILQERQQLQSLFEVRILDFHQSYVDDVSWLNEYMSSLVETMPNKSYLPWLARMFGDLLLALKTPSRFQSVRKLNMSVDLKGIKPVGRLFLDSIVNDESSKTNVSATEVSDRETATIETEQSSTTVLASKSEARRSLVIHHDSGDGTNHMEITSTKSINISKDENIETHPEQQRSAPLNEIEEVEDEEADDDEVVTVLKTPRANPLNSLVGPQDLETPLANKTGPRSPKDDPIETGDSDKENIPSSQTLGPTVTTTPRPFSRNDDSYVTARSSVSPEDPPIQQPALEPGNPIDNEAPCEHEIIEKEVPLVTSPERQMHLPSLPTRAPLNMKKSFGVRKSQQPSLLDSISGRTSIIPNRKTFFAAQVAQQFELPALPEPPQPAMVVKPAPPAVTPMEERPNSVIEEKMVPEKKEKDDTITIIDTELHLGEQRLKTKFTTHSQRIFDALNSLKLKSTPGQALRDATQERIGEMETPAPVRNERDGDDEGEDWIPKKVYSSLAERLVDANPVVEMKEVDHATAAQPEAVAVEIRQVEIPPPVVVMAKSLAEPSPPADAVVGPIPAASTSSATSTKFKSAAAQAVEVIRNAMAIMTNNHPTSPTPKQTPPPANIYPNLRDEQPMLHTQPDENFTNLHDDNRASFASAHDSAHFTQSDGIAPCQSEPSPPVAPAPQPAPPTHVPRAAVKPKQPALIRVPTASQRQKEQAAKKALTRVSTATLTGGVYPNLTQSRSVPDLATPAKMARDEARASNVSVQSMNGYMGRGAGIKALNAAKLAKQREEQERERKQIKKNEMDRKRQEAVAKRQEEDRRKQAAAKGRLISKDDRKRPAAETMRPAKKLPPPSPQKKQVVSREDQAKPQRPQQPVAQPSKKHALDTDDSKPRPAANYTGAGKVHGQAQQASQDTKRRRTDEAEEKPDNNFMTAKPMRVSVIKQAPTKSIGEPIRQAYTGEPKKGIKISSAHQHVIPAKTFMAPAEGVKFSNDPIAFASSKAGAQPTQGKRSIPNNYPPSESIILPEIDSEFSDSEDDSPKKPPVVKPAWAESPVLIAQLKRQQFINPDEVFGEIKPPAIDDIFRHNGNRRGHSTFRPRSSSANWSGQDKLTREEIEEYARTMGYSKP